jgi:hypothetical protein
VCPRMSRLRDCIFCPCPNGSKEHTFPAALGGRRMNKGILCDPCNAKFSALDAEIAQQLAGINGLLGVRGDHLDEPRPASGAIAETGETYSIDRAGRPLMPSVRVVSETTDGTSVRQVLVASNDDQLRGHVAQMRERGFTVAPTAGGRREAVLFFAEPLKISWNFGGPVAFRAAGRIALNFLAHHFPGVARDPGLAAFKAFVLGESGSNAPRRVAHSHRWPTSIAPSVEPFSHRVLVGVDSAKGRAFGRVSFFGTFDVAVDFGALVNRVPSATVVVDIRPLVEDARGNKDVAVQRFDGAIGIVAADELEPRDVGGEIHRRLGVLLGAIEERQRRAWVEDAAHALNLIRDLPDPERETAVLGILEPHRQVFFNLVKTSVRLLTKAWVQAAGPHPEAFAAERELLQRHIAADPGSDSGITPTALATLNRVYIAVCEQIAKELGSGPTTARALGSLFFGELGVVFASMEVLSVAGPAFESFDVVGMREKFEMARRGLFAEASSESAAAGAES